jgi:cAMP-dependent protein kinase regulator
MDVDIQARSSYDFPRSMGRHGDMSEKKRLLKEEAQRALSRGDWSKALRYLQEYCAEDPADLRSRHKVAELLERLGRKEEALREYRKLAEDFEEAGFLLQAVSVNKIILRIDPSQKDVNERLAHHHTLPPIPLFSELNEQELQSLVSQVQARTFQKDETICQEGESSNSLMVISRGEVGIFKRVPEEEERWIRNLKEGDLFGEFGFFTDQKRHATVKAATECEVFEIPRNGLNEIIGAHSRIREVLSSLFEKRVLDLFVSASPVFSSLSSAEREEVFKRFRLLDVARETLVFQGGDPPNSLYMIKRGAIEIFMQKPGGDKIVLATLESGDFFGEIGPLFNTPRMASAKTIQDSELLELTKVDLDSCLFEFPHIRSTLVDISMERLTQTTSEIFSQKKTEKIRETMV